MWLEGVEVELRRLIWQIAVVGKYISAKIHEVQQKTCRNEKYFMVMSNWRWIVFPMKIMRNKLQFSGFVREYGFGRAGRYIKIGTGKEKYIVTADPLDGSSLVDSNLAIERL